MIECLLTQNWRLLEQIPGEERAAVPLAVIESNPTSDREAAPASAESKNSATNINSSQVAERKDISHP